MEKIFIQLNKTSVGWHLKREKNIRNIIKIRLNKNVDNF